MGLPKPVIEMIFAEHAHRAITGDVAFIGRQTTFATEKSLHHLGKKYNVQVPSDFQIEIDKQTRNASLPSVTDRCLMQFLGVKNFSSIDVSDYEGADIICDLCLPLPESLHGKFDFIFNGSCLDNIFNPAEAMCNLSRLLRPNGRLVMIEHGTMFHGPYTIFSPGWFFDFFCYNSYLDCKVYSGLYTNDNDLHLGPWPLYLHNYPGNRDGGVPHVNAHIMYLVIAEKGINSTDNCMPIQRQYRDKKFDQTTYASQAMRILNSGRKAFGISRCDYDNASYAFLNCGYLGKDVPF